jgi:glycerol-1-phosphate dehydrogenase [NAD(P)+]
LVGKRPEVVVGPEALPSLYRFCTRNRLQRFFLVADRNTYAVLGKTVEMELRGRDSEVISVVLQDEEIITDALTILRVLLAYSPVQCTFLAVGSGTITDVTRFVSYETGNPFISLPTAPSVDGYSSANVPMIVDGIKKSRTAHAPAAIFADSVILCSAPRPMIAAGFGDMLGKYTSVADWRLGHLLWDEPYDESIARRSLNGVRSCADAAQAIGRATPSGIVSLMEALIESGFCMTDFGSSLPASGTEHHYSHCWEMKLLREGRPSIFHGAKVGVAAILVAELYERLRQLSRGDALDLLKVSRPPLRDDEVRKIRAAFGPMADEIISTQSAFLDLRSDDFERLKQHVIEKWPDIQAIAAEVPPAERMTELLAMAGGPASVGELGLNEEDLALATRSAHFLRGHFTVRRLMEILYPGTGGEPALGTRRSSSS